MSAVGALAVAARARAAARALDAALRLGAVAAILVAFVLLGGPLLPERAERASLAPILGLAAALAALPSLRTRGTAVTVALLAAASAGLAVAFHRAVASAWVLEVRPVEVAWTAAFYFASLLYVAGWTRLAAAAGGPAAAVAVSIAVTLAVIPAKIQIHRPKIVAGRDPALLCAPSEPVALRAADGVALAGRWVPPAPAAAAVSALPRAEPDARGRVPAVVIAHGLMAEKSLYYDGYGRLLHELGYAVVLFDFRGHGESEGHVETFGLREVEDVRAAVAFARARPEVDPSRVAILGHSMGAAIAVISAAQIPEIGAVVSDAGYDDIALVGTLRLRFWNTLPEGLARWMAEASFLLGRIEAGVDFRGRQPIDLVARIAPRPILFLHGDRDGATLPEYSRRLYEAAGEPKQLVVLPGVAHNRTARWFPRALVERPLAEFLARSLPATRAVEHASR